MGSPAGWQGWLIDMKEPYAQLYREMLSGIGDFLMQDMAEKLKFENCFQIARNYGRQLKNLIKQTDFSNDEEEIDFFRNVKPQFTCYVEYFVAISTALFFLPAGREDALAFWHKEKHKFPKFCLKHEAFIHNYESGKHDSDHLYFLRENNDFKLSSDVHIYDADVDWCTSHDRILRDYLAYKMYSLYCDKKLSEMAIVNAP